MATSTYHGILLNGPSSAGKTSIADAIVRTSELPFVRLELDTFLGMIEFRHIDCEAIDGVNETCERLVLGFQACVKAMASKGNLVLVDHVLQEPTWRQDLRMILAEIPLFQVGFYCDDESLLARERTRGDRPIGLAKTQMHRVHLEQQYDLTLDTSGLAPQEGANQILNHFMRSYQPAHTT